MLAAVQSNDRYLRYSVAGLGAARPGWRGGVAQREDILALAERKGYQRPTINLSRAIQGNVTSAVTLVWWTLGTGNRRYTAPDDPLFASDVAFLQRLLGRQVTGVADLELLNVLSAHRAADTALGKWVGDNLVIGVNNAAALLTHARISEAQFRAFAQRAGAALPTRTEYRGTAFRREAVRVPTDLRQHPSHIRTPRETPDAARAAALRWQADFDARTVRDAERAGHGEAAVTTYNLRAAINDGWWTRPDGDRRYTGPDDPKLADDLRNLQRLLGQGLDGIAHSGLMSKLKAHAAAETGLGRGVRANLLLLGDDAARAAWSRGTGRAAGEFRHQLAAITPPALEEAVAVDRRLGNRPTPAEIRQIIDRRMRQVMRPILRQARRTPLNAPALEVADVLVEVVRRLHRVVDAHRVLAQWLSPDDRRVLLETVVQPHVTRLVRAFNASRARQRARIAEAAAQHMAAATRQKAETAIGVDAAQRTRLNTAANRAAQAASAATAAARIVIRTPAGAAAPAGAVAAAEAAAADSAAAAAEVLAPAEQAEAANAAAADAGQIAADETTAEVNANADLLEVPPAVDDREEQAPPVAEQVAEEAAAAATAAAETVKATVTAAAPSGGGKWLLALLLGALLLRRRS